MIELRQIARHLLAAEQNVCSIPTDALVNSAFLRTTVRNAQWRDVTWENRQHFFADMVLAMRRSLIDHIRRQNAVKRPQLCFVDPKDFPVDFQRDIHTKPELLEILDEALELLEKDKPDLARLIQLHYYIGLTTKELATLLSISEKTVDRSLKKARIILYEEITELSAVSNCPP